MKYLTANEVFLEVVNYEHNKELLKTIPHRRFLDLAVCYRIMINANKKEIRSALITN